MEGVFLKKSPPEILISSHRPPGRQVYNCAHELGHYLFNHGSHIDEVKLNLYRQKVFSPEEFLADTFAGFLLMPKTTVNNGFLRRGWNPGTCTAQSAFKIACWLGVGYSTLLKHMQISLSLISKEHADHLLKISPKQIRLECLGKKTEGNLVPVDYFWTGRPIDIQVGDMILLPPATQYEGKSLTLVPSHNPWTLFKGEHIGIARVFDNNSPWACFVRVSRKGYVGLSRYRHLEDNEDD
ncbi:ImmA/IrrE family metallo-endopeptidase [Candidatus Parvarchaeota archaeon]|nr:ImmA/IrrE family metallo-endopeptidase [Candidatus Parvarchaeota archaeon]